MMVSRRKSISEWRKSIGEKVEKIRREVGFEFILIVLPLLSFQQVFVQNNHHIGSIALRFIIIFNTKLIQLFPTQLTILQRAFFTNRRYSISFRSLRSTRVPFLSTLPLISPFLLLYILGTLIFVRRGLMDVGRV